MSLECYARPNNPRQGSSRLRMLMSITDSGEGMSPLEKRTYPPSSGISPHPSPPPRRGDVRLDNFLPLAPQGRSVKCANLSVIPKCRHCEKIVILGL